MNNKKIKTIFLVWLTIFIVLTFFVVYSYFKLEKEKKFTSSLEKEILLEKESILSFENLLKNVSNIKADSEKANTFFIKRDEVVNLLNTIESLASTTKTQILIKSVGDKSVSAGSSILSVVIQAQGSYSNIFYLIKILEELPYQTEIQSVKISNEKVSDEKNQIISNWSADIKIIGIMI